MNFMMKCSDRLEFQSGIATDTLLPSIFLRDLRLIGPFLPLVILATTGLFRAIVFLVRSRGLRTGFFRAIVVARVLFMVLRFVILAPKTDFSCIISPRTLILPQDIKPLLTVAIFLER